MHPVTLCVTVAKGRGSVPGGVSTRSVGTISIAAMGEEVFKRNHGDR